MSELLLWGWNDHWQNAWSVRQPQEAADRSGRLCLPGRILSQREDTFTVVTERGFVQARPAGVLFHRFSEEERPAVGDWVELEMDEEGVLVSDVLPRQSRLLREAPGGRGVAQLVASNVDTVFVVSPVVDLNLNRLERFMVAICAGGAEPRVVLSKGDLATPEQVQASLAQVRELMDGLVAVTTSAPWTSRRRVQDDFASLLAPAHTYALVGASGAGKSTLLNALVGEDLQATAEVRAGDGKGRHVTSFRELFALSSGALMIDTPGMREFGLWADDGGLERVFSDVLALAEECRFADCTHNSEPGCAVLGAVEEGCLARRRLENWRQLKTEMDENAGRRMIMQARRERGTLMRKKKRDKRFSGR